MLTHCNNLQKFFDLTLEYLQLPVSSFKVKDQDGILQQDEKSQDEEAGDMRQISQNEFYIAETSNYLSPSFIGHMIPLKCGHTG